MIINAAVADDAAGLLDLVDAGLDEPLNSGRDIDEAAPESKGQGLLRAARRLRRDDPKVILVDGLIDTDIGYDVFGRLRDELWALGHTWAVAVRPRDSAALRTPPADAFWSTVIEIPPLQPEETERLLRLGLTDDELSTGNRHGRSPARIRAPRSAPPRTSWIEAATLTRHPRLGGRSTSREHRCSGERGDGRPKLQGLGRPVSAHDPELLEPLGWSRPYAQRILSHLEEGGVLRSIPERSDRAGHTAQLYELNPDLPPA